MNRTQKVKVNVVETFLVFFIVVSLFLGFMLYRTFKALSDRESDLLGSEADNELLQNRVSTLLTTNHELRSEIRQRGKLIFTDPRFAPTQTEEIETTGEVVEQSVEPNPQHFRPMFDSQGALFNVPNNGPIFYPEGLNQEEAVGYESGNPEEREDSGLQSVQDGEETTNGVLRSGPVS